jgi:hypothetical protein
MAEVEVACRFPAGPSASDGGNVYIWWLKFFASIGVLTLIWIATAITSTLKSWLSGGYGVKSKSTAHKSVQGPVTYHTTPSASKYQPLAEHAWGAW